MAIWRSDFTSDWLTLNFSLPGTNGIKCALYAGAAQLCHSRFLKTKHSISDDCWLTSCFSVILLIISLWSMRESSSTSSSSLPADSVDFCLLKHINNCHQHRNSYVPNLYSIQEGTRVLLENFFWKSIGYLSNFSRKMQNIDWFQILKYKVLMVSFVIYDTFNISLGFVSCIKKNIFIFGA